MPERNHRPANARAFYAEQDALLLSSTWYFADELLDLDFEEGVHGDVLSAIDKDDYDEGYIYLPRGCFKSHALASFCARSIAQNRDWRGFLLGVTHTKTAETTGLVRQFLESDKVVRRFGVFKSERKWNDNEFIVEGRTKAMRESTLTTFGIQSFQPGGHFNFRGVDDIESQDTVTTPELMEKTKNIDSLGYPMVDEPGAKSLYFGTFYDDNDLYNYKMRLYGLHDTRRDEDGSETIIRKRYIRREIEVELEDLSTEKRNVFQFWKPATNSDGTALFPRRLSLGKLAKLRLSMRPDVYASQYELDPIAKSNAEFKSEWMRSLDRLPKTPMEGYVLIDAARSLRPDGDYTGWVVLWIDEEFTWYVTEAKRLRIGDYEFIDTFIRYARIYPDHHFVVEEDGYVAGLKPMILEKLSLARLSPRITFIKSGGRKTKNGRVSATATQFAAGKVFLFPGTRPLEEELLRWPKGSRKDVADAFANILGKDVARASAGAYDLPDSDPRDADPDAPWNHGSERNLDGEDIMPYDRVEEVPDRCW